MGSFARTAGGVTAAMLIGAGGIVASSPAAGAVTVVPCSTASLVAAITAANTAGSGSLQLASNCNYDITTPNVTGARGADGLPIIKGNIRITGGTATRIRRASSSLFRIFEVASTGRLTLRSLFVEHGDPGPNPGGGILNEHGTVTTTNVTVALNTADSGAGLANDQGTMTLNLTLVDVNKIRSQGGGGGAIYNDGTLVLNSSRLTSNSANTHGGGIFNEVGTATITQSTLDLNVAGLNGGGFYNTNGGSSTKLRTLITRNSAGAGGGGVFNNGTGGPVTLTTSSVTANSPNDCTGAVTGC